MSFKETFDETNKDMGNDNDFYKFKTDGEHKFRIMSEPQKKVQRYGYGICYQGAVYCQKATLDADWKLAKEKAIKEGKNPDDVKRPNLSVKWSMWAISRSTNKLVILDLSNKVVAKIRQLMDSDEYKFESFPMPYDVTVTVKHAGTKEAEYDLIPARKESAVTEEELAEFAKLTPVDQIIERMKAKKREQDGVPAPADEKVIEAQDDAVEYPEEDIDPKDIPF